MAGPKIAARRSPRTVAQAGLILISAGAVVMLATLDVKLNDTGFKIAMVLVGAGGGSARLAARQRDHVVDRRLQGQRDWRPAGHGPQPRGLTRHRPDRRDPDPQPDQRVQRQDRGQPAGARLGAARRSPPTPRRASTSSRSPRSSSRRSRRACRRTRRRRWPTDYGDAQLDALRVSIGAVAAIALLCLWFTRRLPTRRRACPSRTARARLTRSAQRQETRRAARTDGSGRKSPRGARQQAAARTLAAAG